MAALDLQEQEQLEAFKAWWKENSNQVFAVLLIVLAAIGGWRGWQYYHQKQIIEAATLYEGFSRQLESNDAKRINDAAAAVMEKYASSAYASRAALQAAKVNEEKKDLSRARMQLHWVIDHAEEEDLKSVARLRLAAILIDEEKYAEALALLGAPHPSSFDGLYSDLRGDALSAQGKTEDARSAYKLAYEKADKQGAYRNLIEMKLDALGVAK